MVRWLKFMSIKSRIGKKIKSKSARPILIWSRYRLVLHRFEISDPNNLISWQGKFWKSGWDIFGGSIFNDLSSQPRFLIIYSYAWIQEYKDIIIHSDNHLVLNRLHCLKNVSNHMWGKKLLRGGKKLFKLVHFLFVSQQSLVFQ